ncbi:MAG: LysR family transcriptional regulator [Deltaproteobacteria bacterium]
MSQPRLHLRLIFDGLNFGPGKADLLALIGETGSISAAGRRMKMSYKRAWSLVEEMNAAFREPLVDTARGGPGGGGASLTTAGEQVLAHYQAVLAAVTDHAGADVAAIGALLVDMSDRK